MTRQHNGKEDEGTEVTNGGTPIAVVDTSSSSGTAAAKQATHQLSFNASSLQQALSSSTSSGGNISNQQQQPFSFLDPNVMMMTNAAATIAAVAASAVQQMNQQQHQRQQQYISGGANAARAPPPPPAMIGGPGAAAAASLSPALLASLRNVLASQAGNSANAPASIPPHLAAILAAAGMGGGGSAGGGNQHHHQQHHGLQQQQHHQHHHHHHLHQQGAASNAAANHHGLHHHHQQQQQQQASAGSTHNTNSSAHAASQLHRLLQKDSIPNKISLPPPAPTSLGALGAAAATGTSQQHSGGSMQNWNVAQLEKHVSLLKQMNQPVPQSVALLLADAQRREKKKTAKRAANRKSASTSRARKKALVEEMTRTNARLKRQALILALLPDLVVATSLEGEVTFCSAQVERILGHKPDDLVGVQLDKVLVPLSRDTLQKLFKRLVNPNCSNRSSRQSAPGMRGTKRRHGEPTDTGDKSRDNGTRNNNGGDGGALKRGSSQSGDGNSGNSGATSGAALISETSFPLSVVEVESKQRASRPDKNNSDANKAHDHHIMNSNENSEDNSSSNNSASNTSGEGKQKAVSSLSNSQSPVNSPSEEDDAGRAQQQQQGDAKQQSKRSKTTTTEGKGKHQTSSGDESTSSLSSKAENMRMANDNLDRNVRWHNQRLMGDSQKAKSDDGPKDDVTGASVTANNASARLSSLKHVPSPAMKKMGKLPSQYENDQSSSDDSMLAGVEEKKKVGDTSDDSGYRESNDSREESSSSGSDSSNSKNRRKPLAPTCRLCLIRADLTTVWCEVTSSLRTRTPEEDPLDLQFDGEDPDGFPTEPSVKQDPVQEFLLCFRPMRDGDKKADESLRLVVSNSSPLTPPREAYNGEGAVVSTSNDSNSTEEQNLNSSEKMSANGGSGDSKNNSASSSLLDKIPSKRPPKKRSLEMKVLAGESAPKKKQKPQQPSEQGEGSRASDTEEKSVVESLMLMNKSSHGISS